MGQTRAQVWGAGLSLVSGFVSVFRKVLSETC